MRLRRQLGWEAARERRRPVAGGALITKIGKAFGELEKWLRRAAPRK